MDDNDSNGYNSSNESVYLLILMIIIFSMILIPYNYFFDFNSYYLIFDVNNVNVYNHYEKGIYTRKVA